MCGLAGLFGCLDVERTRNYVNRMLNVQTHRGPDSNGSWCGTVQGVNVGIGFRRLKILDLSDAANQPMVSEDDRFVLIFNGEIYNYVELRKELETCGIAFRTKGDTEVLLNALITWGSAALPRLNGMWALVLLDRVRGEVLLSRDRFGIKPLYTYSDDRGFLVASEIKAILEISDRRFEVNANVADAYLHQGLLCTSTSTFFAGIEEFPAGHVARVLIPQLKRKHLDPIRYWSVPVVYDDQQDKSKLVEEIRATFVDSVRLRLRSDVPIGILLSGGVDSSAIAAAVHHLDSYRDDIKLISAVGRVGQSDEQPFIDVVAAHLNRHVEKVVLDYPPEKTLDLIGEATWFNDEPLGSFSTLAHYLLMKRARELDVTVLLSGQGADESLCGYNKYLGFYLQQLIASGDWLVAAQVFTSFMRQGTVLSQARYREAKRYLPNWFRLSEVDVRGPVLLAACEWVHVGLNGGVRERQVLDLEKFSVPALVHYEDRMSMAQGREIRLPFLDYRLVSLLVRVPVELKLRAGWTKWIFRKAIEPFLPDEITWRRDKQNFIVPQNDWLKSELRENLGALLRTEWITERLGLVDRKKFGLRYNAYLRQRNTGGKVGVKDIFAPIALELWARRFEKHLTSN